MVPRMRANEGTRLSAGVGAILWVAAFASACGPSTGHNGTGGDDMQVDASGGGGGGGGGGGSGDAPVFDALKMDILFVIDNSGSMSQEQTNLVANFPQFVSVLEASNLDYRVAVTTTSVDYHYRTPRISSSSLGRA